MIPRGWRLQGSAPADYAVALPAAGVATLKARGPDPAGFGTLMQVFAAEEVRGKRLRLGATIEARGVRGWSGLWMRVDGARRELLAFDNMQDRPITGDAPPARYVVVLDVSCDAAAVAFGVLLEGAGEVSITEVAVETVGGDVPTTAAPLELPARPQNLGLVE